MEPAKTVTLVERHTLLVDLTPDELNERASEMSALLRERSGAESDMRIARAKAKAAQDHIDNIATVIMYKQEPRPLDCTKVLDFGTGEAICRRPDGTLIYRRPLTFDERQQNLPGIPAEEPDPDQAPTEGTDLAGDELAEDLDAAREAAADPDETHGGEDDPDLFTDPAE